MIFSLSVYGGRLWNWDRDRWLQKQTWGQLCLHNQATEKLCTNSLEWCSCKCWFPLENTWCSSSLPIAIIQTDWLTATWAQKGLFISQLTAHHGGQWGPELNKAGTQKQELKQRPWGNAADWPASLGFLSLLSYLALNHLLRCGTLSGQGPPTSIINQENPPRTCPQANLMEVILDQCS